MSGMDRETSGLSGTVSVVARYPVDTVVRDQRYGWLLKVEERFPGGATLRYLHSGVTLMATVGMLDRGFEEVQS